MLQGRFDEAEQLLAGFEDEPEAIQAAISLRLARGRPEAAVAVIERRLDQLDRSSLLAVPLLARLVEAQLQSRAVDASGEVASQLEEIAASSGRDRIRAAALLAAVIGRRSETSPPTTPSRGNRPHSRAGGSRRGVPARQHRERPDIDHDALGQAGGDGSRPRHSVTPAKRNGASTGRKRGQHRGVRGCGPRAR